MIVFSQSNPHAARAVVAAISSEHFRGKTECAGL
jgi:hypothetical protein